MKAFKGWAHLIGFCVLLLAALSTSLAQTTYRWDDADGQTHYSDQAPPTGALNVKVLSDSGPGSDDSDDSNGGTPSYLEQEAAFQERQAEQAEQQAAAEQERSAAAARKKNCELARSNYNTFSAGGRITRLNADGEREYLSDEQIAQETKEARKSMEKWCES